MLTHQQIEDRVRERTLSFISSLDHRYVAHVSNKFLEVYLVDHFMDEFRNYPQLTEDDDKNSAVFVNIAYKASVTLFESYLEHGCKLPGNGHHTAQRYAGYFENLLR